MAAKGGKKAKNVQGRVEGTRRSVTGKPKHGVRCEIHHGNVVPKRLSRAKNYFKKRVTYAWKEHAEA